MNLLIKTLLASGILFVGGYGTYKVIDTPKSNGQTQDKNLPSTPVVEQSESTENSDQVAVRSGSNGNSDVSLSTVSAGDLSGQNLTSSQPEAEDVKQTVENQGSDNLQQNKSNKEKDNDSGAGSTEIKVQAQTTPTESPPTSSPDQTLVTDESKGQGDVDETLSSGSESANKSITPPTGEITQK